MNTIDKKPLVAGWQHLGTTESHDWLEAWLQLHWASQLVARVAQTFLPAAGDDSHPNMGWIPDQSALLGRVVPAETASIQVSLSPADLTLHLLRDDGTALASMPLSGISIHDAERWLGEKIAEHTDGQLGPSLSNQIYELPDHPVASGTPFGPAGDNHEEISRWYGNAQLVLEEVRVLRNGAEVRCWPHHFDIATLLRLDAPKGASIGVGLAPADAMVPEPYWYVNAWPIPEEQGDLPPLVGRGRWQTEGWFGAILSASDTRRSTVEGEVTGLVDFLKSAIGGIEGLLVRSRSNR